MKLSPYKYQFLRIWESTPQHPAVVFPAALGNCLLIMILLCNSANQMPSFQTLAVETHLACAPGSLPNIGEHIYIYIYTPNIIYIIIIYIKIMQMTPVHVPSNIIKSINEQASWITSISLPLMIQSTNLQVSEPQNVHHPHHIDSLSDACRGSAGSWWPTSSSYPSRSLFFSNLFEPPTWVFTNLNLRPL